jgi:predicted amidophosphoribosyltransferase
MKFCPQCGRSREGKFCSGCGFAFEGGSTPQVAGAKGEWLPDPSDPKSERYWTGSSWTDQTRPIESTNDKKLSAAALLKKLSYGTGFDRSIHCRNCGKPLRRSAKCSECQLDDA